jgi:hypothetical protein
MERHLPLDPPHLRRFVLWAVIKVDNLRLVIVVLLLWLRRSSSAALPL